MTNKLIAMTAILVFAGGISLPGCHRNSNLTEQERIQRAKDFEDKGNLKGSIVELKNAIQKNPNSPQARLLLGQIYLKAGMGAEAEKELTKAEKLGVNHESIQPQLGEALLLMGEYKRVLNEIQAGTQTSRINLARIQQIRADALLNQGKIEDGCNLYSQSMITDKNNPPTYWGLAKCAVANHDMAKAKEWLDMALKIDRDQAKTWIHQGDLCQLNNDSNCALAAYTNALKAEPNNLDALGARASTNLLLGKIEPARKDLDQMVKLAPKTVRTNYLRALFEFQQTKYSDARDALHEVFKITENYAPSVVLAGATAYALGSNEEAQSYLKRILVSFPNNTYARRILAATQIRQNQPDKAIESLSPLLSTDSKDIQALSLAAEAYLRIRDYNKAMEYLDRAAKLAPQDPRVRIQLAEGYMATQDTGSALANFEQVASRISKPSEADLGIVMIHLQRKEYDEALQAIAALEKKLPNNPVTQNLRAVALFSKQDRVGARKALEQALAIQPTFFPAVLNLARLDIAENKPDVARKRFESLLEKDKNNAQAMTALANLAVLENNEGEYVSWMDKAVKADPKAIKPRALLTRYYLNKKENQKALALANDAVNSNPDSLEALSLLGATQMATGDNTASITTYTRMTQKAPQSPVALLDLALAQIATKQPDKARRNLQQAVQLQPDFVQAVDALINLELADKKPEAALQVARHVQVQQPNSPLGFEREGDIELSQKHYPLATKAYEQALAKGAGSNGLINLHRALILAGDSKSADQRLSTWIAQNPNDVAVRTYAAEYDMASNRNLDAIAQYEAVLKLAPQNALNLNNLASLYQREKDSRALATAEQALKLDPNNPAVQDTLGWILVGQGQAPRALELLRQAVEKASKIPTIRYHYAVALAKSGNETQARAELQKLLASGQKFPELGEATAMLRSLPSK